MRSITLRTRVGRTLWRRSAQKLAAASCASCNNSAGLWHTGGVSSESSDAELIASSELGAFAELYERHADDVLRYFVRRTGCGQTAADLTAETFAEALASRRRFRDVGAPGRAWLFTIARRQLSRFVRTERVSDRARRRVGMQRIVLAEDDIEQVERLADFDALGDRVRAAVASLPQSQSEALMLRVGEGLAYREVALRLGCSEGAARVRVSRGLSALTDELGAW